MKLMKEEATQHGAERTALTDANLLQPRLPSCGSNLHGDWHIGAQRRSGCQHEGPTPTESSLLLNRACWRVSNAFCRSTKEGMQGALGSSDERRAKRR